VLGMLFLLAGLSTLGLVWWHGRAVVA
jgi:hypothetical protein